MSTVLPSVIEIDGIVHTAHYKDARFVITQNYGQTTAPSSEPILMPGGVPEGENLFHVFRIEHNSGGESVGELLASYSDLHGAMTYIEKAEPA